MTPDSSDISLSLQIAAHLNFRSSEKERIFFTIDFAQVLDLLFLDGPECIRIPCLIQLLAQEGGEVAGRMGGNSIKIPWQRMEEGEFSKGKWNSWRAEQQLYVMGIEAHVHCHPYCQGLCVIQT